MTFYVYASVLLVLSTLLAFATLIADLRASLYRLAKKVKPGRRWALDTMYSLSSIVTFRLHILIEEAESEAETNPIIVEERLRGSTDGITVLFPHGSASQPLSEDLGPARRLLEVEIGSKVEITEDQFVRLVLPTQATQYVKFPVILKLISALRRELRNGDPVSELSRDTENHVQNFLPREQLGSRILMTRIYTGVLGALAVLTFSAGTLLLLIRISGTPNPAWLNLFL
jgi:hypothetical protein